VAVYVDIQNMKGLYLVQISQINGGRSRNWKYLTIL